MLTLYGDGIHDDYPAIQAQLDSGASVVYLPCPKAFYVIGRCLKVHSNQELRLDRFTRIMLADGADCSMVENCDPEHRDENIAVTGGIWDMNHAKQSPNPYHFDSPLTGMTKERYREEIVEPSKETRLFPPYYSGHCMRFNSVRHLILRDITIRNPVVYGIHIAYTEHFTVENIVFDYTEGSPKLWNLDGIHLDGGCRNGYLHNLQGACHDDLVALTSYDLKRGTIENITIDGIIAEGCHSAVRLLSIRYPVRNVHITNIFGSFYVYCIIMSRYYNASAERGVFENIRIDNVFASFCKGTADVPGNYGPFIDIEDRLDMKNISIEGLTRRETVCFQPTVGIGEDTVISHLRIRDCVQTSTEPTEFLRCAGEVTSGAVQHISIDETEYETYPIEKERKNQ